MRIVAVMDCSGQLRGGKERNPGALNAAAKRGDAIMRTVAVLSSTGYDEPREATMYPYVLASFAYRDMQADRLPARVVGAELLWVDSGAFTVWAQTPAAGKEPATIDLGAYVEHLHRLRERVDIPLVPINLDVIPGVKGGPAPTARQARDAMRKSEVNADRIRAAGHPVMEVWHRGEPIEQLLHLAERRRPGEVLGIGGLVGLRPHAVKQVCDPAFAALRDRYGWQDLPPVHGLGVGNQEVLWRYPWWSCDSSSWIAPGVWGRVLKRNGHTERDPRARNPAMRHRECAEILRRWLRWNVELTELWAGRGIRFNAPPVDTPLPVA